MAEVANPSVTESTTKADGADKSHKSKPEKPDEEKYKVELAKAEKEHAAALEKLVRFPRVPAFRIRAYISMRGLSTASNLLTYIYELILSD